MVEIYASWSPGLVDDSAALKILKDSKIIAGIETCDVDNTLNKIEKAGLKYNLHNALFKQKIGLDNPNFINALIQKPNILAACKNSYPPVLSFHAGHEALWNKYITKEEILSNTVRNIKMLDQTISKKIIFETPNYYEKLFTGVDSVANKNTLFYVTSPEFFRQVLAKTNAGYLFDINHNLVSGAEKIRLKEFRGEIQDYFAEILLAVAKETYQIHLNVPNGNPIDGYLDIHGPLKLAQKNSKLVLMLAKEIIDSCPNIKVITMEETSGLAPKLHAKLMVKQAQLIQKHLL
ncbi:MAG: hypothetical protein NTY48_05335 [Candidatus Diapherotrites archaeon]|nr:hypothetical protein [Candidatus Diapherotrites archaeon]